MTAPLMEQDEELQFSDAPVAFEPPPEDPHRQGKRAVAAMGSALLGLPGDIAQAAKGATEMLESYMPFGDALKRDPTFIQKGLQRVLGALPTRESLKESMIAFDPNLAPQDEYEQLADEMIADFTTLALPVKGKIPFFRALGTSVFSNMAAEGAKQMGGSPAVQGMTKIGSMFIAGLIGRPNADQTVRGLYEKTDNLLPDNAFTNASRLEREAANIQRDISRGAMTPTKQALGKFSQDVVRNIDSEGNILMENVAELRRNLNEIRGDPSLLERYAKRLNSWDRALTDVAEEYGKKNAPWLKSYQEANAAFGALKKSDKAVRNIMKAVDPETLGPQTSLVLGLGGPTAAAGHLGVKGTIAATATGYRIMQRIATNPSLRRHYSDVMKASLKDNAGAIVQATNRLDTELQKSLEKEPIEILDLDEG